MMACQFNNTGKYFGHLSDDGKLKVWDVVSNKFEQEFTPDVNLTSFCTCLQFFNAEDLLTEVSPKKKKKKRKDSLTALSFGNIVLGTNSAHLIVYSIAKAGIECVIDSKTNQAINCLSVYDGNLVYSGTDQNIITWNIKQRTAVSNWKCANEKITSILAVQETNQLYTASKTIKLWCIQTRTLLKTLTGHSSDILYLYAIPQKILETRYVISGSKEDRLLSCWNVSDKDGERNAVANFLMEDMVQMLSVRICTDGLIKFSATVRSGVVHIYYHTLNGKCGKPVKPRTTIQIVSDTGQKNEGVIPVAIIGATFKDDETLCMGYGNFMSILFEDINISKCKKVECLLRKLPFKPSKHDNHVAKIVKPVTGDDVHILTTYNSSITFKRKADNKMEVPMEKRLENLTLNKLDIGSGLPKSDNVGQLLLQGLHSKDRNIIKAVLSRKEDDVILNTIKRLPMTVIVPLVEELTRLIQGKTISSQIGAVWLRHLIQIHSSLLISNPVLPSLLAPVLGSIESRMTLQTPLTRLHGRLNLLMSQLTETSNTGIAGNENAGLVFFDKESSESENEDIEMEFHSESELEWEESDGNNDVSNEGNQPIENGISIENSGSDDELSS